MFEVRSRTFQDLYRRRGGPSDQDRKKWGWAGVECVDKRRIVTVADFYSGMRGTFPKRAEPESGGRRDRSVE
jgi:hypothetical protein